MKTKFVIEKDGEEYLVTRDGLTTGCETKGDAIGIIINELS